MINRAPRNKEITGKGWHGDPEGHARAGAIGGRVTNKEILRKRKKKIKARTS